MAIKREIAEEVNPQTVASVSGKGSYPLLAKIAARSRREGDQKFLHLSIGRRKSLDISEKEELKRSTKTMEVVKAQQIYFNKTKKYNYMKQIIDKYFEDPLQTIQPGSAHKGISTIIPKLPRNISKAQDHEQKQSRKLRAIRPDRENQQELQETISDSRVLFNDSENGEMSFNNSLSFSRHPQGSSLPPIDELFEGKEDELPKYESLSTIQQLSASTSVQKQVPLTRNEAFCVELVLINGRPNHRIKTFSQKGIPVLSREQKAFALGVDSQWKQYKYDPRALVSSARPSIKELIFKAKKIDADSKFYTLKPQKYQRKLMANCCEEFKRVLREFCKSMQHFEGRVVNNKVNIGNLYIGRYENWRLGQWGYSSFRESHIIQGMEFENRLEPIFKSQKEWFVAPQYMAPQIIRAVALGEQIDLIAIGSASDIWSLGVLIFEVLTIVPVWIVAKCVVYGREMAPRQGLLSVGSRDLKKMLKKQEKLGYLMMKIIEEQWAGQEFDSQLISVMQRCVNYDPSARPSYEEIIAALS